MITLEETHLKDMLIEAARLGANQAIDDLVTYNLRDTAERLGVSYATLQRRIAAQKIRAVDGRVTGAEIRRYLTQQRGNA